MPQGLRSGSLSWGPLQRVVGVLIQIAIEIEIEIEIAIGIAIEIVTVDFGFSFDPDFDPDFDGVNGGLLSSDPTPGVPAGSEPSLGELPADMPGC